MYVATVMDNQDGKPDKWITRSLSGLGHYLTGVGAVLTYFDLKDDCGKAVAATITTAMVIMNRVIQAATLAATVTLGFLGILGAILVAILVNILNLLLVELAILGCQQYNLTLKIKPKSMNRKILV